MKNFPYTGVDPDFFRAIRSATMPGYQSAISAQLGGLSALAGTKAFGIGMKNVLPALRVAQASRPNFAQQVLGDPKFLQALTQASRLSVGFTPATNMALRDAFGAFHIAHAASTASLISRLQDASESLEDFDSQQLEALADEVSSRSTALDEAALPQDADQATLQDSMRAVAKRLSMDLPLLSATYKRFNEQYRSEAESIRDKHAALSDLIGRLNYLIAVYAVLVVTLNMLAGDNGETPSVEEGASSLDWVPNMLSDDQEE